MITLPSITQKQQEILQHIFRFRFLDRTQIQKLLNHKDYKTINLWLKDLTEKQYIAKLYRRTNSPEPTIYYMAKNGIIYTKQTTGNDTKSMQKYHLENRRSDAFITKQQLLADIHLDLRERSNDKINFSMFLKSDYQNSPQKELLCDLMPDAYIEQKAEKSKSYFLEVFQDLPTERLRQRIKRYLYFLQSNEWEAETNSPAPTTLIICPNNSAYTYIKRYTKTKLRNFEEPSFKIHLSLADEVKEVGITGDIWKSI